MRVTTSARLLGGGEDVARVVDEVDGVEAEAQRGVRLETAKVDRADAPNLAWFAAVETDRARPVDEPQLGEEAECTTSPTGHVLRPRFMSPSTWSSDGLFAASLFA